MKYWDDYFSKFGFGDGDQVPADAQEWRVVALQAINPLLDKYKSSVRLIPYDRGGMHNSIMLFWVDLENFNKCIPKKAEQAKFLCGDACFGYAQWDTPPLLEKPDDIGKMVLDATNEVYRQGELNPIQTIVKFDKESLKLSLKQIEAEFKKLNQQKQ